MGSSNGTALVVIDVQNAIVDGEAPIYRRDEVLRAIADLLANARGAGVPVFHVQHENPNYPPLTRGADGWQIHPAVAPVPGEPVIQKRACDAFYGTSLRGELDARGVTRLVMAGCETDFCIDTAARRALSLDFDVVLVADAHTTTNGSDDGPLTAAQIVAHHNAVLANIPHPTREIVVRPVAEIAF